MQLDHDQASGPLPEWHYENATAAEESQATARKQPKVTTHTNRIPLLPSNAAFASLMRMGAVNAEEYSQWSSAIGIRNRIVHEYMNLNRELILNLVRTERYSFIVNFMVKKTNTKAVNHDG